MKPKDDAEPGESEITIKTNIIVNKEELAISLKDIVMKEVEPTVKDDVSKSPQGRRKVTAKVFMGAKRMEKAIFICQQ